MWLDACARSCLTTDLIQLVMDPLITSQSDMTSVLKRPFHISIIFTLILFSGTMAQPSFGNSLPSPREQIQQGIPLLDVVCNTGKVLAFRTTDSSSICVNAENIAKLVNRDIIYPLSENPLGVDSTLKNSLKSSSLTYLSTDEQVRKYLDLSKAKIEISNVLDGSYHSDEHMIVEESSTILRSPSQEPQSGLGFVGELASFSETDHSTTNIQVGNVDEPDYVKNDGTHIFVANDHAVTIIDANPQDANIVEQFSIVWSDSNFHAEQGIHDMFLDDNELIILLKQSGSTKVIIADISSRESATLLNHFTVDGSYQSARMIDGYVYLITSLSAATDGMGILTPNIEFFDGDLEDPPTAREENSKVFAFSSNTLPDYSYKTVTSFDTLGNNVNIESYLMGDGNTLYVSENSIYITYVDSAANQIVDYLDWEFVEMVFPYLEPVDQYKIRKLLLENHETPLQEEEKWLRVLKALSIAIEQLEHSKLQRLQDDLNIIDSSDNFPQTVIQKIDINKGKFNLVSSAKVSGTVLNQFSMDEHNNQFRIATTSWDRTGKSNSVNVFDIKNSVLVLVGSLDKIAPNEDIYSARFVDDTLYLVTFRQIDPFFVIDLSKNQPKILGELKIPGFSNYLHPFGKDHVIGIGRDGGVKLAMFDVSDFNNPKQNAQIFIGNQITSTEAEENHKSVLIDFSRQLLVIPVTDHNNNSNFEPNQSWYGFYVYQTNEQGFTPKGTVEIKNSDYYNGRSLYIGDTLYSITPDMVSINKLNNLEEIGLIDLQPQKFLPLLSE